MAKNKIGLGQVITMYSISNIIEYGGLILGISGLLEEEVSPGRVFVGGLAYVIGGFGNSLTRDLCSYDDIQDLEEKMEKIIKEKD